MKNITLFLLCILLLTPLVISAKTTTVSENGLNIEFADTTPLKFNTTYKFHFHVVNSSNGLPAVNTSIKCLFHLYNKTGSHLFKNDLVGSDDLYDFEQIVHGNNFTQLGSYSFVFQCNSTASQRGGFIQYPFEVTLSGEESKGDNFLIFFWIIFILLSVTVIYFIILTVSKLVLLDMTVIDVSVNFALYVLTIILYWMCNLYISNLEIINILNLYLRVGVFTNIILPMIVFILTMIKINLDGYKKA